MASDITQLDNTAFTIGQNYSKAQDNVLEAYSLKDDADKATLKKLADKMGVKDKKAEDLSVRGLQLIAEQRLQSSGQMMTFFSNVLEKANQLKERLINNIGR